MNASKTDKTGGAVGRPSWESSLLSDPDAKFSVDMWRKPQRRRNNGQKAKKRRPVETDVQTPKNGDETMMNHRPLD